MKKIIITVVIIAVLVVLGIYFFNRGSNSAPVNPQPNQPTNPNPTPAPVVDKTKTVLGKSVQGNDIIAYNYGNLNNPDTNILFIGGIHGGYEWNTSLVAFQLMDYLKMTPAAIASNERVTVIPVLNPDGLAKVTGSAGQFSASDVSKDSAVVTSGRFNANTVDLNRNFDCDWQAVGKWQNRDVSGGTSAFSEPESQAIQKYVTANKPTAVIVWYSSAGGVFSSSCHNGVSTATKSLTQMFSKASGYPAHESFNFYEITGDMVNWLAKNDIPAISVLLTNHTDTEWSKNKAGVDAVLKAYATKTGTNLPPGSPGSPENPIGL